MTWLLQRRRWDGRWRRCARTSRVAPFR